MNLKKLLILNIPYVVIGLLATKLGEGGGWQRGSTPPKRRRT